MTCPVCSAPITEQPHRGRSRIYCSPACRIATKRAAEKRRRAIPAAERDLEDALAAHAKHGLPVTAERVERARADLNALTTPSKENTMTITEEKITVPTDCRLVVLFEHCDEPGCSNSHGFIVDKATAYEQDGDRVYVHDEHGVFHIFEGVREAVVLEAALPRIPTARFYQPDEIIEPQSAEYLTD